MQRCHISRVFSPFFTKSEQIGSGTRAVDHSRILLTEQRVSGYLENLGDASPPFPLDVT